MTWKAVAAFVGAVIVAANAESSRSFIAALLLAAASLRLLVSFPGVTKGVVGFFHPNAEDGGGGERVLWCAIKALQQRHPQLKIVLFTGRGHTVSDLTARAKRYFNIGIDPTLEVVPLSVKRLDPVNYPRFTMLGQALASVVVAWEGLQICVPQVFVDTSGWAFSYPLAWYAGSKVGCYVHYPTISSNMLSRVQKRQELYNNNEDVAKSATLSQAKLLYYHVIAWLYKMAGRMASVVMVNSTWTKNHIEEMWRKGRKPVVVYPPVDTTTLQKLPLDRNTSRPYIISIGQFRPEKNHELQLRALASAREIPLRVHEGFRRAGNNVSDEDDPILQAKLKIVGSCRNAADRDRLAQLKSLAVELGIEKNVEFHENIPFNELIRLLGGALGGLHTMLDEHFGIVVVEYQAAGVIPIVHSSGGPKMDILKDNKKTDIPMGYICDSIDEYGFAIRGVVVRSDIGRRLSTEQGRENAKRFSQEKFQQGFLEAIEPIIPKSRSY